MDNTKNGVAIAINSKLKGKVDSDRVLQVVIDIEESADDVPAEFWKAKSGGFELLTDFFNTIIWTSLKDAISTDLKSIAASGDEWPDRPKWRTLTRAADPKEGQP